MFGYKLVEGAFVKAARQEKPGDQQSKGRRSQLRTRGDVEAMEGAMEGGTALSSCGGAGEERAVRGRNGRLQCLAGGGYSLGAC